MATQSNLVKSAMVIKYSIGVNDKGKEVIKTDKFSNLTLEAKDEDIQAISEAFGKVMAYPINYLTRENSHRIIKA